MAGEKTKEKHKPPSGGTRYVHVKAPPKRDRTRTDEPKEPTVLFTDWASI